MIPPSSAAWSPLTPDQAVSLMAGVPAPWWIAGGWAIDLFLGRQTREHHDLDLLVLRRDQLLIHEHFEAWDLHACDPPGSLKPWHSGDLLAPEVHDVWCRPSANDPWQVQLMMMATECNDWVFRREPKIRGPLAGLGCLSSEGIPILRPEIQLLFKGTSATIRPKDDEDFLAVVDALGVAEKGWLAESLELCQGPQHPWLHRLPEPVGRF